MYKVIIVDDEKLVLYGIRAYITEHTDQFQVTGTFTDADEAIMFCREEPPDIILTDIKMPGTGGLQFIEKVKGEQPGIRIVVLSCHDDYPLVRKSFTLGAEEYILKHEIEEEELVAVLERIAETINGKSASAAEGSKQVEISELLKTLPEDRKNMFPEMAGPEYLVCCIGFRNAYDDHGGQIPWHPDLQIISTIAEDYMKKDLPGIIFADSPDKLFLLLSVQEEMKPSKNGNLCRILDMLRQRIRQYVNREVFIGTAGKPVPLHSIETGCSSALHAFSCSFYQASSSILFSDTLMNRCGPENTTGEKIALDIPPVAPFTEWVTVCREYFSNCRALSGRPPGTVRAEVSFAFQELDRKMRSLFSINLDNIIGKGETSYIEKISSFDDMTVLGQWVLHVLSRVNREFETIHESLKITGMVKHYIDEHYAEPISLQETAERFNVNMNYFSQLFKREAGINFTEYINRKRIEKAKDLLLATDLPVKEICYKVGYNNPNYLSRIFKRISGITISGFRETLQERHSP